MLNGRLLNILYLVALILLNAGCGGWIDGWVQRSARSAQKTIEVNPLTFVNAPVSEKGSSVAKLNVRVKGAKKYRYKLGPSVSTVCSESAGYLNPVDSVVPIVDDLASYSDQSLTLCVWGVDENGVEQPIAQAIHRTWYFDRAPAIVSVLEVEQSANENSGSNQTIHVVSSVAKPYPLVINYTLKGDAVYQSDHTLPVTGSITIPANKSEEVLYFRALYNPSSVLSSSFELNLSPSDETGAVLGEKYTTRFIFKDVDGGVRPTVRSVSFNGATTCAILSNGVLRCSGVNTYGQVGDGTTTTRATPVVIDPGTSYSQVVTASDTTCGITSTGRLKCWGRGSYGTIGDGGTADRLTPTSIDVATSYSQLRNFGNTACGIVTTTGVLKCWGLNGLGQVGDGTTVNKLTPTIIHAGTSYATVDVGSQTTCAISTTGALRCWGLNLQGQLGIGSTTNQASPALVDAATSYAKVFTNAGTTCGLTTGSVLKCWGSNALGSVGDGTTLNKISPVLIDGGTTYSSFMTYGQTSCGVVAATAALKCWGRNDYGQVGDGTYATKNAPTVIDPGVTYLSVATNGISTYGIQTSGQSLKAWGNNGTGQLGDGTGVASRNRPTEIDSGVAYQQIAAASNQACGLTDAGDLKCWGQNGYSLGDGSVQPLQMSPVTADAGETYVKLVNGGDGRCGLTTTGAIRCWGLNASGQLGDGTFIRKVVPGTTDAGVSYSDIAVSNSTYCGITRAGVLKCWGRNDLGQVGDGTTINRNLPTVIDAGHRYASINMGNNTICGITTGGVLKCWGFSAGGALGDGTTTDRLAPVVIDAGVTYSKVSVGNVTCGITTTGALKCWGTNGYGAVGDGTGATRLSPVVIDSGVTYTDVKTSIFFTTCGITTAGVLKCWGRNDFGQVGDGTNLQRLSPVVVNSGASYSSVTATNLSTCGITTAGALKCWGLGGNGTLGDGTTLSRSAPVLIDTGTSYRLVDSVFNTCGITTAGVLKCWGTNATGQVGDGTTTTRTSPTVVESGTAFQSLGSVGSSSNCAVTTAGVLKCWGANYLGQLGDSPKDLTVSVPRNLMKWFSP